jgi:hypothetical protein
MVTGFGACVDAGDPVILPPRDAAIYAASIHPIAEVRCGTLDCHGSMDRPLRLYSETGLRLLGLPRTGPLTQGERDANIASLGAVDPAGVGLANLNIAKPLRGGIDHEGGELWADPGEPEVVCLVAWLDGTGSTPDAQAACMAAVAGLPPL